MKEIKDAIHQLVDQIDDERKLEEIHQFLTEKSLRSLSQSDQGVLNQLIDQGEEDIRKGDLINHEEVEKFFASKLND